MEIFLFLVALFLPVLCLSASGIALIVRSYNLYKWLVRATLLTCLVCGFIAFSGYVFLFIITVLFASIVPLFLGVLGCLLIWNILRHFRPDERIAILLEVLIIIALVAIGFIDPNRRMLVAIAPPVVAGIFLIHAMRNGKTRFSNYIGLWFFAFCANIAPYWMAILWGISETPELRDLSQMAEVQAITAFLYLVTSLPLLLLPLLSYLREPERRSQRNPYRDAYQEMLKQ